MTNVKLPSIEDYDDPSTRDQYQQYLLSGMDPKAALAQAQLESRDNARTPMQWDGSENGGFTSGTPWLKTNPNTRDINVEAQRQDPHSIYQCYRKLIALRKQSSALSRGGSDLPGNRTSEADRTDQKRGRGNAAGMPQLLPGEAGGPGLPAERRRRGPSVLL